MVATQSTDPNDRRAVRDGEEQKTPADAKPVPRSVFTFEKLKEVQATESIWVATPELGEGVGFYIRHISASDRAAFETDNVTMRKHMRGGVIVTERIPNMELVNERLMIRFCVDEEGNPAFASTEKSEMAIARELAKLPAAVVGRVGDKISDLMGWSAEDLEDLTGN